MANQQENPEVNHPEQGAIELSGPQQRLYEALTNYEDLATMYRGAVHLLKSPSISDRFAMAAHNLRELMDSLPEVINVPKKSDFNLKSGVNELNEQWNSAKRNSDSFDGQEWSGEIGSHLQIYFAKMEAVFSSNRKYNSKQRKKYADMVRQIDPSNTPISGQAERSLFNEWREIRTFWLAVCHHGRKTNYAEVSEYVERLEMHILRRLRPKTFETQKKLDQIIRDAEGR